MTVNNTSNPPYPNTISHNHFSAIQGWKEIFRISNPAIECYLFRLRLKTKINLYTALYEFIKRDINKE